MTAMNETNEPIADPNTRHIPSIFGDVTYHRIAGDWWRHDTPTIQSGLVVRYTYGDPSEERGGEIAASRDGVIIQGHWHTIKDPLFIVQMSAILGLAMVQFKQMARQDVEFRRQSAQDVETDRKDYAEIVA